MSNCVLNLAQNKAAVFADILRVLRVGGRTVISDIVADRDVDPEDQEDEELWGECYTGALSVGRFIKTFAELGFAGLTQLDESAWKKFQGYHFGSLTLKAFKFPKTATCEMNGHLAVYLGPYALVRDDEAHDFPRFEPVEICEATATRLKLGPYAGSFIVVNAPRKAKATAGCGTGCCAVSTEPAQAVQATPAQAASACCDSSSSSSCG